MQTIPSLPRNRYLARFGTLLIAVALIAGTVGCPASPAVEEYALTVSSTEGGSVTTPDRVTSTYDRGAIVDLVATADAGYRFVEWTGDVGTIANVDVASTTITMNGDYSITASFVAVYTLMITSTGGGSVTAPGEGDFTYDIGTLVNLVAAAEVGYRFVSWTGDVSAVADAKAAATTISMSGDYSITAGFEVEPTGAFVDEIVITREPSPAVAIQQLKNGTLDIYAWSGVGGSDPLLYAETLADPGLTSLHNLSWYVDLTFNPVGPIFPGTGKLNPFSVPEFREAMHWLVDRDHIADEIIGLAVPRYTCLNGNIGDGAERYSDLIGEVESQYGHNPDKAALVVAEEMLKLGAVLEDGRWRYGGEPIELVVLIRLEDERKETGDYIASLLQALGFSVARQYGTAFELAELWLRGDPARGEWHVYTGGWAYTSISRDEGWCFGFFYTNLASPFLDMSPLWQSYQNSPVFYEAAERLWHNNYSSLKERAELFEICLEYSMKENQRMFLANGNWFVPLRATVRLAHDLAAGVSGSWLWAMTAHFVDDAGEPLAGGTLRVAVPNLPLDPWNQIAGTNQIFDTFAIRATGDMGHWPDTRTGLRWQGRIDRAEVFVTSGLPVGVTNTDWCTLTVVPEIQVPLDAWADWDAVNQEFFTVEDRFGSEGTTALTKSVSYYPKDIFGIPLHDGSTLSMGDFILYTILQFDRAKEDSAIYDESAVGAYNSFMNHFRGVRFITDDPDYGLIVEYYSDQWRLDAELMVTTMFPFYSQGPGMWHTIALGIRAEGDGALAFSGHKAGTLGVAWMNLIDGPSLPILEGYLDSARASNYIPYEPTMGLYVIEGEAAERWSNLDTWHADKGHFWVASGPFYLESADMTAKVIHLKRFVDYPDPMDKWLFLLEPLP